MFSALKFPRAKPAAVAQGGYACACSFLNVRLRLFLFPRERKSIYRLASKFVLFRFVCFLCLGLGFGKFEPAGSFFPRLASSGLRVRQGLRPRGGPFRGRPEVVNPAQVQFTV